MLERDFPSAQPGQMGAKQNCHQTPSSPHPESPGALVCGKGRYEFL